MNVPQINNVLIHIIYVNVFFQIYTMPPIAISVYNKLRGVFKFYFVAYKHGI